MYICFIPLSDYSTSHLTIISVSNPATLQLNALRNLRRLAPHKNVLGQERIPTSPRCHNSLNTSISLLTYEKLVTTVAQLYPDLVRLLGSLAH
jgi:hypothetical protein